MINKVLGSNFTTKKILATETLGESSHLRKSILDYFGLRFILLGGLVMPASVCFGNTYNESVGV